MKARQILRLDNGTLSASRDLVEFSLHTSAGQQTLAIPVADIAKVMQFFADLARLSGRDGPLPADLYPIALTGLGFQDGQSPDTMLLVAKIGAAALALEIPRNQAADMARRLLLTASGSGGGARLN
jgi:hypothetical protein